MQDGTLELTASEAAVALAVLVSFSDDDPSEAEGVILRKYYRFRTARSLQDKLASAGYAYPTDLPNAEEIITRALRAAPVQFRLRSLAVAWMLALADGTADHNELRLLSRYADALGVGLADTRSVADAGIPEIDERTEDELDADTQASPVPRRVLPDLNAAQAGISMVCEVAFSDDNPSDGEAAVLRDHYSASEVESFIELINGVGYPYPEALPELRPAVLRALRKLSRDEQLRRVAIAGKAAAADGQIVQEEEEILRSYCEELGLGLYEIETYFTSSAL